MKRGKIISVASHQGSVGKTTILRSLSNQLAKVGYKVQVIDTDSQGSLSRLTAALNLKSRMGYCVTSFGVHQTI